MANPTISDERLLRRVGEGDPESAYTLLMRHTGLVGWALRERGLAGGSHMPGLPSEDAEQAGLLGLWRAIQSYRIPTSADDRPSAQFTTYAKRVIANAIEDEYRRARTDRQSPLNRSVPLEDFEPREGTTSRPEPVGGDVERQALAELEFRADLTHMRQVLTDQEYLVLRGHLSGLTYVEIAGLTALSYKAVDGAMQRIRKKARAHAVG